MELVICRRYKPCCAARSSSHQLSQNSCLLSWCGSRCLALVLLQKLCSMVSTNQYTLLLVLAMGVSAIGNAFDLTSASLFATCSKAAKEYNAWKTWVYKHGDKPWPHLQLPDNKADIANLMMLDALLDPSIKGMVDASKPSAG